MTDSKENRIISIKEISNIKNSIKSLIDELKDLSLMSRKNYNCSKYLSIFDKARLDEISKKSSELHDKLSNLEHQYRRLEKHYYNSGPDDYDVDYEEIIFDRELADKLRPEVEKLKAEINSLWEEEKAIMNKAEKEAKADLDAFNSQNTNVVSDKLKQKKSELKNKLSNLRDYSSTINEIISEIESNISDDWIVTVDDVDLLENKEIYTLKCSKEFNWDDITDDWDEDSSVEDILENIAEYASEDIPEDITLENGEVFDVDIDECLGDEGDIEISSSYDPGDYWNPPEYDIDGSGSGDAIIMLKISSRDDKDNNNYTEVDKKYAED